MLMGFFDGFGINSVLSGIGGIADSILGHYESNRQMHFASDEAKAQREWSSQESQKNRDWQQQMYELYNTPSAMMKQYKEANLNPFLLGSESPPGSVMSASPSQGAGHGASAPGSPAPTQFGSSILQLMGVNSQVSNQRADSLLKISQALPELGKSLGWDTARKVALNMLGLQGIKGSQYEKMLDQQIEQMSLQNSMQRIQNSIANKFGEKKASAEVAVLEQSFNKISAEIGMMASNTKVNESVISKNKAEIRKMASEFVRNHKEALYLAAQTNTLDQLREYVVRSAKYQALMLSYDESNKRAYFEGTRGIRSYLFTADANKTFEEGFVLNAERNADEFWSLVLQLGSFNVGVGTGFYGSSSTVHKE